MKKIQVIEPVRTAHPTGGILVLEDRTNWYIGQSNHHDAKTNRRVDKHYFLPKGELCDRHNANACQRRAIWYGYYRTDKNHVYALYRCSIHGFIEHQLVMAGPEALKIAYA